MSTTSPRGSREGQESAGRPGVRPEDVHEVLRRHLLVDGYPIVFDHEKSHGSYLVDARDGTEYLDFYSFFASLPLGLNPPGLADDPEFLSELGRLAVHKPANSDVATVELAEFCVAFDRVLGIRELPNLFFIEGGALAVENALKVAFDWKSRRNEAAGRPATLGMQVMHLRHAFHGRSGYTLSLTNTDPVKVDRYPKFDWPRIPSPAVRFPLERHLAEVERAEEDALAAAREAFERHPHDICCFVFEPIQAEGGDRHLRAEFLQSMQALCHEFDALLVCDEVQTGAGVTGTPWCHQQLGLEPDVVAFGKKVQLGGIMAGRRVQDEPENVFNVPSRINSTFGGNLVDMTRSRRLLETMESTGAMANAREVGGYFLRRLEELAGSFAGMTNARGRGLLLAIDLPDGASRREALRRLHDDEHVIALPCGDRSIRFRPSMLATAEVVDLGCEALGRVAKEMSL